MVVADIEQIVHQVSMTTDLKMAIDFFYEGRKFMVWLTAGWS